MFNSIKIIASVLFLGLIGLPAWAAGLKATLSATEIAEGDQVVLSLSADLATGAGQPDLSVLETDFRVLGTTSGTQATIINGRRQDSRTWQVTLMPKREGQIVIPPIEAGAVSSEPLRLSVLDAASLPPAVRASRPSVTVSVEGDTLYAHQEVPLTVRARLPAGTRGAQISAPESTDVLLNQVGEDRTTRQPDGTVLLERKYFMRPQREGTISLDPFTVVASVADQTPSGRIGQSPFGRDPFAGFFQNAPFGRDPFGSMFARTRNVTAVSEPLVLQVNATPGGASGWALPAKGVELREIWQPDPPVFEVGAAVTRKIQVVALGAHGEQIPDIDMPAIDGARVYFEGSDTRSVPTRDGTAAMREFTWSIVPTTGGELALPEIGVDWFDVTRQEKDRAVVAAQRFDVEGPIVTAAISSGRENASATQARNREDLLPDRTLTFALVAAAIIVGLLVLAIAVRVVSVRRAARVAGAVKPRTKPADDLSARRRSALGRASRAAKAGDDSGVHRAAMDWIRASGLSVEAVHVRLPDIGRHLDALEASMFSSQGGEVDLRGLVADMQHADRMLDSGSNRTAQALPPLYPAET
ncbi:BatD family protein [Pseudaestuariivita atlantica]|uniref:Protein BatD n=1 Tax=Pseudaestuariivita atlantica TaxID=1317121 RepID=A0A0L1JS74_9RHOB|nr:BatD family protein [Pseudaestuariivita atlantica]KNG94600.1 hypothetical protein ATO11_04135 [Pseudaestuariivita atlantica]